MRDAVGGGFMIKVFIVFLGVYVVFMAIALNYAKTFRVKNQIINIIEQNEGISEEDYNDNSDNSIMKKIYTLMGNASYQTVNAGNTNILTTKCTDNSNYKYIDDNYLFCIDTYEIESEEGSTKKYYKITTFVNIELPFFKMNIPVPIKGETRMIERINP